VAATTVVVLLTAIACAGCGARSPQPVAASPPPLPLARVATLRVGLPAAGRSCLLFTCDKAANDLPPRIGSSPYGRDALDPSGRRWLRLPGDFSDSAGALAPDTLLVRAFDDATDEEIALERGELDVAVFWPGEVSARMRADARFGSPELGLRARGVLACEGAAGDTQGPPWPDMELLNREAFGGDLLPWSELKADVSEHVPARYTVDATLPGAKHLERILERIPRAGVTRTLKLVYADVPWVSYTMVARGEFPTVSHASILPLFALRCPVLVRPGARDGVRAIGAHAFAELAPCDGGQSR
jgi:hypothetical protein